MYDSELNVLIVCYLFLGGFGVFALYELITRPFKPKQTEEEKRRLEALYAEQSDRLNRYRIGGGHKRKKEQGEELKKMLKAQEEEFARMGLKKYSLTELLEEGSTKAKDALLKSSDELIEEPKAEAKQRVRRAYLDLYSTVLLRESAKLLDDDNRNEK